MLGSQFVLGLRATNCATGAILADEQAQATRKEDVLDALSQIASRFRTRVGESLVSIRAMRSRGLLAGMATQSTGKYEPGIAAADKAIALAPDSAPAYNSKAHNQLRLNRPADAEATIASPDLVRRALMLPLAPASRAVRPGRPAARG
jgi:hypothetical protein